MEGKVVGKYVIEARLGGGGMGTVYRARHVTLGRVAAVKVLLPELCANADFIQRFFNEARAATSIHHLGIVEVYDYGRMNDGIAYIAMELLHGETLARRIKQGIAAAVALRFVRLICGALGAAHDRGIVHRDLKPDNVFIIRDPEVTGGERIKLLDFGIAKLTLDPSGQHKTRTGTLIGTPAYMAPEQCRGVQVDWRADIYALGCILYQLFAGTPPFRGEGVGDVLGAHMYAPAVPIDGIAPGVWQLIERMLAKQPADRPQTTGAIIDAIDALLAADAPLSVTPPEALALSPPVLAAGSVPVRPSAPSPAPPSPVPPPRLPAAPDPSGAESHATTLSAVATVQARPVHRRRRRLVVTAVLGLVGISATAVALRLVAGGPLSSDLDATLSAPARTEPVALPVDPGARPGARPGSPPGTGAAPSPDAAVTGSREGAAAAAEVAPIHIKLDSAPRGGQVIVDGRSLGTTPYEAVLPRRDHSVIVTIRRAGYQDARIEAAGDRNSDHAVTLDPRRPVPPVAQGPRSASGHRRRIGSDEEVNPFSP